MIQVTSYNVLADMYTDPFYFPYCTQQDLSFQNRSRRIVEEIISLKSDIVCLQEVDHFEDFYSNAFEAVGYERIFMPKVGRKEGVLTLVKKASFVVEGQKVLDFDQGIPQAFNINHFKRNGGCQLTQLTHIATKTQLIIANTHLFWNPACEEVKLLQTAFILEELSKFQPKDNVILCGDFNSMPSSNVYHFITALSEPTVERIEQLFRDKVNMKHEIDIFNHYQGKIKMSLKSSYDNYEGSGAHPEFTNYTQKFKGTLDYIFFNPKMSGLHLEEVAKLPISQIKMEKGLPNPNYPSDHIPITARFKIIVDPLAKELPSNNLKFTL